MNRSRRRFKFSKAFVGRIAAVGLFVLLGSFAVYQSIRQTQKSKTQVAADATDVEHSKINDQPENGNNSSIPVNDVKQISAKPASFEQDPNSSEETPRIDTLPPANSNAGNENNATPPDSNSNLLPGSFDPGQSSLPDPPVVQSNAAPPNTTGGAGQFGGFSEPPVSPNLNNDSNKTAANNSNGSFQLGDGTKSDNGLPTNPPDLLANNSTPPNDPFGSTPKLDGTQDSNNSIPTAPKSFQPDNNLLPGSTAAQQISTTQFGGNQSSDLLPKNPPTTNSSGLPPAGLPNQLSGQQVTDSSLPQSLPSVTSGQNQTPPFQNDLRNTDTQSSQLPNQPPVVGVQDNAKPLDGTPVQLPSNSDFSAPPSDNLPPAGNNTGQGIQNNSSPIKAFTPDTQNFNSIPSNNGNQRPIPEGISAEPKGINPNVDSNPIGQNGIGQNTGNRLPANPANSINNDRIPNNTGNSSNSAPSTRIRSRQTPSLTLQKIAPAEVTVNQETTIELVVRNVGQSTAENVTIRDRIPQNVQVIKLTPQPIDNRSGDVTWNIGSLPPGTTKKIQMRIKPVAAGEINSIAQVTFTSRAGAVTKITKPRLKLTHSASEKTLIGRDVLLRMDIENVGDGPATNVVIQEKVPTLFRFAIGNREEKEIEYAVGTLRPGQKRSVTLRLRAIQVGSTVNQLLAHADGGLQAQHQIDLKVVAPKIGVEAKGPGRRFLGRPAEHEFTVKNTGTAAATNVDLVAKLPRGLRFSNANHHGQYNPNTHTVVWSLERLDPGVMGKVKLTTLPMQNGNQTIEFTTRADQGQKETTQATMLVYQIAELYFDIKDETDALEVGTETVYTVRVVNKGSKAAKNVNVSVDFGAGIKPIQVDGTTNQVAGQTVALPRIPTLGPKQQKVFRIRARGVSSGDHRVVASMSSDERKLAVKKEESTHVYSDQ